MTYNEGYDIGAQFRQREEAGWDPGNIILATMLLHKDEPDWIRGFEHALNGVVPTP
jgi:hypothetical protein